MRGEILQEEFGNLESLWFFYDTNILVVIL
jgi:hypothetical protein